MIHLRTTLILLGIISTLTACQSLPTATPNTNTIAHTINDDIIKFTITGKIGITTNTAAGRQAGSAFYTWSQEDMRFAIDLTGALGMGATQIRYNGQTATLTNDKGEIEADNPEALLLKATGWHAPISQLPYWISGKPTEDDTDSQYDTHGRLSQSTHDEWVATFEYTKNDPRPSRLIINHHDGHRVVMTATHTQ